MAMFLVLQYIHLLLSLVSCYHAQLDSESFKYESSLLRINGSLHKSRHLLKNHEQPHQSDAEKSVILHNSSNFFQKDGIENYTKCPTWTYKDEVNSSESICKCGSDIDGAIKCNATEKKVFTVDGYCMTYNKHHDKVVAGECLYGCIRGSVYRELPSNVSQLNHAMCGKLNRHGRLCSKCNKGYLPLVYSYDFKCIKCHSSPYNWVKYIAIATLPTTCFYILIVLFRVNVLSPQLHMLVQIGQLGGSSINIRPIMYFSRHSSLKLITIPYGFINIDFFRAYVNSICVDLTTLQTLALDYITAIYPLILVIITYGLVELHAKNFKPVVWIWKPFNLFFSWHLNWDIQSSIVKVFSTVLLLSYGKTLSVTFDILLPTRLYNIHGESLGLYLYYDASYEYFSREHLPYATLALFVIFTLIIPPPLVLSLYLIKGCCKCLKGRGLALQMFVECFYGYYKDGTEPGTRDCRWFPAMWFFLKSVVLFTFLGTSKNLLCYVSMVIFITGVAILVVIFKPYKLPYAKYNTYDTVFLLLLAMWCASVVFANEALIRSKKLITLALVICAIIPVIPLVYITLLLASWLHTACLKRCGNKCLERLIHKGREREAKLDDSSLINALEQEREPLLPP